MTEKYKLRIDITSHITARKSSHPYRSWVWDSKEAALACKALLEKAVPSKFLSIEFVSFTEEQPLEDEL